jgi:hypothetical protein
LARGQTRATTCRVRRNPIIIKAKKANINLRVIFRVGREARPGQLLIGEGKDFPVYYTTLFLIPTGIASANRSKIFMNIY